MRRSKLLFLFSCVILICALAAGCASTGSAAKASGGDALSLWNDEAPAKKALTEYVAAVTKEGSADFIPKEHRVAVFDLDGTLFCETHPTYFDIQMFIRRVTEDPTYTPTKAMIDYAENFKKTGVLPPINTENEQMFTETYKGMTLGEFAGYVESFMETDQPGYTNLKRKDAFYKPMVELIHYLIQNDFTVYVSSGTNRMLLRTLTKNALGLPPNQIIGSDSIIIAKGQGDTDDLGYIYTHNEELVLAGKYLDKNLQMTKTSKIVREIGTHPVISFGNTMTDASMVNYVMSNPTYRSLGFMVICDDFDREYGNPELMEKMTKGCNQYGWIPVSMKNDWKTIYGENVKKTE